MPPFDDIESEILRQFFGLKPRLPREQLLAADPDPNGDDEEDDRGSRPVRVDAAVVFEEFHCDAGIANAAARICLSAIASRLPNWGRVRDDGQLVLARRARPPRRAPVVGLPRFLFAINWADSAPGYSWPEAYYVTPVPGFDRFIVTKSQDCDEAYGGADLALGWFRDGDDPIRGIGRSIRRWWRLQKNYTQPPWQSFLAAGEVSQDTALAWQRRVWGKEVDGQ